MASLPAPLKHRALSDIWPDLALIMTNQPQVLHTSAGKCTDTACLIPRSAGQGAGCLIVFETAEPDKIYPVVLEARPVSPSPASSCCCLMTVAPPASSCCLLLHPAFLLPPTSSILRPASCFSFSCSCLLPPASCSGGGGGGCCCCC